ncbi:catalase family protein [Microbulbifer marinus]|uniref:Catalase n=1 Tax=Microbulbifer marinus TaxID=658218 RepID=A0A1H4BG24_9GAMM|nr:catalase family protein [Microbulbifer marinus]SEA46752.1 Catalase [Microbulbifer marinus]
MIRQLLTTSLRPLVAGLCLCTAPVLANSPGELSEFEQIALDMELSPQEMEAIHRAMELGREISRKAEKINGLPYRRDAHAKATGCLRATFSVNGDIPAHFQHSVFAQPGHEYQSWIRFSNGDMVVQPDNKGDARGMAIKLIGVDGQKIAPEFDGPNTHDFIMTNTPAFFNRNIFDYVDNMSHLAKLERTSWFISLWPPRFRPKLFYRAVQTVSSEIDTPLQPQYFSMLPYQLGDTPLKFSARPCPGMTFDLDIDQNDKDYLTEAMTQQLAAGGACFDFMLQEKVAGADMPIDDASVIWSEEDSPFIPVARINIPPQSFAGEAQQAFCENLSMNPWHGVDDWRPLGSLNRARRLVYHAVSEFRHQQNEARVFEPDSWCLEGGEDCDLSAVFHTTKPKWPLPRCFDPQYRPADGSAPPPRCWY